MRVFSALRFVALVFGLLVLVLLLELAFGFHPCPDNCEGGQIAVPIGGAAS